VCHFLSLIDLFMHCDRDFTLPLAHQKKNNVAPSFHDASESEEERGDRGNNVGVAAGSLLSLVSPSHLPAPSAPTSKLAGRTDDPLGEFYAMARAAHETGVRLVP